MASAKKPVAWVAEVEIEGLAILLELSSFFGDAGTSGYPWRADICIHLLATSALIETLPLLEVVHEVEIFCGDVRRDALGKPLDRTIEATTGVSRGFIFVAVLALNSGGYSSSEAVKVDWMDDSDCNRGVLIATGGVRQDVSAVVAADFMEGAESITVCRRPVLCWYNCSMCQTICSSSSEGWVSSISSISGTLSS